MLPMNQLNLAFLMSETVDIQLETKAKNVIDLTIMHKV